METLSIEEILRATGGTIISGEKNASIKNICLNSNEVTEGSLFVPIKGERVDAHDFIIDAFNRGAIATLTQNSQINVGQGTYIYVKDTLRAFQDIASYYRTKFKIPVIGVTGSVGKTSTKEMISSALSARFNVLKTSGNMNSQIGLPLTVMGIENSHDIAVIEMGMSEFGEMSRISRVAQVNCAVITNIGVSHIENLKTRENIRKEKLHIIDCFNKKKDILFLNADDEMLYEIIDTTDMNITYFGINRQCDYMAQNIVTNNGITTFHLKSKKYEGEICIPTIGLHNVYNALASIAIAFNYGLEIHEIKEGLMSYKSAPMRQQIYNINGFTVIDDSYNASPDSIKSGIDVLNKVKNGSGRTIAVLADMLELGEHSISEHFNLGKYIASEKIQIVLTIGERSVDITNGVKSIDKSIITYNCNNNDEAINLLHDILEENDTVLIKGSRGMHTEQIVKSLLSN